MTNNKKVASKILKELELQKQYEINLAASSKRVEDLRKSLKDSYPKFIEKCLQDSPNKFVDIKKFPTREEIRSFYQYGSPSIENDILMYKYGWFNIKELAVIIKLLYSLKKQTEYSIVTLANLETERFGPEASDIRIIPNLNFLIGSNQQHLEKYNGTYFDKTYLEGDILDKYNASRHPGLVRLKQARKLEDKFNVFDNIKLYPSLCNLDSLINWNDNTVFSSCYNIFDRHFWEIIRRMETEPRSKISSLLSFSLDFQDSFIARTLFSIVVYKKKMNKLELDNEDYKYIFYELFKSDVDVSKMVNKEIPKVLCRNRL